MNTAYARCIKSDVYTKRGNYFPGTLSGGWVTSDGLKAMKDGKRLSPSILNNKNSKIE